MQCLRNAIAFLFCFIVCTTKAGESSIVDKTLVAWVAPANLIQRGGGVLTIDDQSGHFDGIVFGELAPAKWMAGSEFFKRTLKDQANFPTETVRPAAFIQIAIVYCGKEVTLFRNAQAYGKYAMASEPFAFGAQSVVLAGKRHLDLGNGGCFAGSIDDLRIYDSALNAEQLASLKPNEPTEPTPWAWWTFDNKDARERTGRFQGSRLTGGAKIEDGKLVLDGKSGMLIASIEKFDPLKPETPAMPAKLPESWLTYHLAHPGPGNAMPGDPNCAFYWKGEYHLHYIYRNKAGFVFAHVSSVDLVHWSCIRPH